jgi:hypothetical protein
MANSPGLSKTIAVVRMATSVFFLLFGEYKVAGPEFAHGGLQTYLQDYIANWNRRTGGRHFLIDRTVDASSLHSWRALSVEYASGDLVGAGTWGAGLALFRQRTGSSSFVVTIDRLLRRGCRTHLGSRWGWCARIAVIAEKIFEEKGNRG